MYNIINDVYARRVEFLRNGVEHKQKKHKDSSKKKLKPINNRAQWIMEKPDINI